MGAILRILEVVGTVVGVAMLLASLGARCWRWRQTKRWLVVMVMVWLLPTLASATTLNVAACNGTNDHLKIQTKVDAAVDGDVVQIQAGSCTFSGVVSWTDKNITVQGAGIGVTIITRTGTAGSFYVQADTVSKGNIEIAHFTVNQTQIGDDDKMLQLNSKPVAAAMTGRFHIHHVKYTTTVHSNAVHFFVEGIWWGLFDHIDSSCAGCLNIAGAANTDHDYNTHPPAGGNSLWYDGSDSMGYAQGRGTDANIFVEDSTFFNDSVCNQALALNDLTYGGRMVWRHNVSVGNAHLQTHPTYGEQVGGINFEVYNNHITGIDRSACATDRTAFTVNNTRSGTGIFAMNTIDGTWQIPNPFQDNTRCAGVGGCTLTDAPQGACNGANSRDGNIEANGWPCFNQIGRSTFDQSSLPMYYWLNGSQLKCFDTSQAGAACDGALTAQLNNGCTDQTLLATYIKTTAHSNGDIDYCNGTTSMPGSCGNHTNTWTPYTYPHPLQGVVASNGPALFLSSWSMLIEGCSLVGLVWHARRVILSSVFACAAFGVSTWHTVAALPQQSVQLVHRTATKAAVVYLDWSKRKDDPWR